MRVEWVHPSWRDLVIEALAADAAERRAFLEACELPGLELALSVAGGASGERALPLLVADEDWDALGDAVHRVGRDATQPELARLLAALGAALDAAPTERAEHEIKALAELALDTVRRRMEAGRTAWEPGALEAWFVLSRAVDRPVAAPDMGPTADALRPHAVNADEDDSVRRLDAWLAISAVVAAHHPHAARWLTAERPMIVDFLRQLEAGRGLVSAPVASALDGVLRAHPPLADRALHLVHTRATGHWGAFEEAFAPPLAPDLPPADVSRVRRILLDL